MLRHQCWLAVGGVEEYRDEALYALGGHSHDLTCPFPVDVFTATELAV